MNSFEVVNYGIKRGKAHATNKDPVIKLGQHTWKVRRYRDENGQQLIGPRHGVDLFYSNDTVRIVQDATAAMHDKPCITLWKRVLT